MVALVALALLLGVAHQAAAAAGPVESIVAQATGHVVSVYRSPQAGRPFLRLVSPNADGTPLVLLVKSRRPGWEEVWLPIRPNGSTGWVQDRAVSLSRNPYRIRISLGAHRLTVWKGPRVILSEPAGVGRSVLPTPTGTYYIVELLAQPQPDGIYGPFAFGLSAYSEVLYRFGGGPGQIGIHGTDNPARLGTDVSHGCIRISNSGITRLAALLPLGTPVTITR